MGKRGRTGLGRREGQEYPRIWKYPVGGGERTVYGTGNKRLEPRAVGDKSHQGEGGRVKHLRAWDHIPGPFLFPQPATCPNLEPSSTSSDM